MSAIGKLAYYTYFKPLSWLRYVKKFGGIFNWMRIESARKAMAKAANKLYVKEPGADAIEVYFLTGKKFWALTAFCMYSLSRVSKTALKPVFIDDGSFDGRLIKKMNAQFPGCVIRSSVEIEAVIQKYLPASKYPYINKKRAVYPHIKKLTDIHAGSTGWKMVLDSDMLFFSEPVEIQDWLANPEQPFFLYDPVSSYHYSLNLMEELTTKKINQNINVGMAGLKSDDIDWDKLEYQIKILEEKEGKSYLLEQALSAMLAAGQKITIADRNTYIVQPGKEQVQQPSGILHHYVAQSKEWYYTIGWKHFLTTANA